MKWQTFRIPNEKKKYIYIGKKFEIPVQEIMKNQRVNEVTIINITFILFFLRNYFNMAS